MSGVELTDSVVGAHVINLLNLNGAVVVIGSINGVAREHFGLAVHERVRLVRSPLPHQPFRGVDLKITGDISGKGLNVLIRHVKTRCLRRALRPNHAAGGDIAVAVD